MKAAVLLLLFLFASAAAAEDQLMWFPFPFAHPYPLPWKPIQPSPVAHPPTPSLGRKGKGGGSPPAPPFQPDPKVAKCFLESGQVGVCVGEIMGSFFTRTVGVGPDCCKAIQSFDKECEETVFACFNNPFFNAFVKQHCSISASSPPSA